MRYIISSLHSLFCHISDRFYNVHFTSDSVLRMYSLLLITDKFTGVFFFFSKGITGTIKGPVIPFSKGITQVRWFRAAGLFIGGAICQSLVDTCKEKGICLLLGL